MLNNCFAKQLDVPAWEGLETRNRAHRKLLRLNGAGDGEGRILRPRGLQIDDNTNVNAVKNGKKRFTGFLRMDPERIQESDLAGVRSAFKEDRARRSEEGTDIGSDCKGFGLLIIIIVERRDRLVIEVEKIGSIGRESNDSEGGLVDGKSAAEGLDMATALNFGEIGGYVLVFRRGKEGRG